MAFQPTTNGARVILRWSQGVYVWSNHLWFSHPDFSASDQAELAEAIYTMEEDAYIHELHSATVWDRVEVIDEREQGAEMRLYGNSSRDGGNLGEMLPPLLAVVVTLTTQRRGRSYRGRVYLGGHTEEELENGSWSTTLVTAAEDFITAIEIAAENLGWTFGVRSGQLDGVLRPAAIITPVTGREVRSALPGTQRRRSRRP
jgi:hypothetical protein